MRAKSERKVETKLNEKIALSVSSGLLEGAFFPLTKKKNIIGRKVNAHIPIQDSKVSREHATIEIKEGDYLLKDLGSTNGTYLNNMRLEKAEKLSVGDNIRIGSYTFRVEKMATQGSPATKWHSETRILYREPNMVAEIPQSAASKKASAKKLKVEKMKWAQDVASWEWPSLRFEMPKNYLKKHPDQVKWLLWAATFFVVFAASFTRLNGFS
jgi:pSer/pThr/pTyr-binding forkhead associated (FHA) protein